MSSTLVSTTIHLDDFVAIDNVSQTKQQQHRLGEIDALSLDGQSDGFADLGGASTFPFDLGLAADAIAEPIDLEKQQQHHLRQFLYYQSLALERQRSSVLQQQAAAASTSISSLPSLSPASSLPPSPRESTASEAITFTSSTTPADAPTWSSDIIDVMQAYQQAPGQSGQGSNLMSDFNGGNVQAARDMAFPSQPYQVNTSRHSISAYPPAVHAGMAYQPPGYQLSGRNSLDAAGFGAPIQSIAKTGRSMSSATADLNGFTIMQNMQAHARNQSQQAEAGELVKGPYMMAPAQASAPPQQQQQTQQQQQQQGGFYGGDSSFHGQGSMHQGFNINYNTAMPSYMPASTPATSGQHSSMPYPAPDLSVPSYYRVHSADPAAVNGQNVGVKPESVSPRTAASDPTGREDLSFKVQYRQQDQGSYGNSLGAHASMPMSRTTSMSADNDDEDVVLNPLGGGRGYVPGETPDDPKKRHKCNVCGRGFARLFNLKSHSQTHDPQRPKPHICPHDSCARSFSRLHDLERHRQGVHFDGPLMVAKRQGISPSIARAQSRIAKRAERGTLV